MSFNYKPQNTSFVIISLLFCIFISLAICNIPFIKKLFRNNNNIEGMDDAKDKEKVKKYNFDEIVKNYDDIEDIIQPPPYDSSESSSKDSKKKDTTIVYQDRLDKTEKIISKMQDSTKYSYKSDLEAILKTKDAETNVIILSNIMKKIIFLRPNLKKDKMTEATDESSTQNAALGEKASEIPK